MSDVLIDSAGFANAIASAVVQFLGAQQPATPVSVASPVLATPAPAAAESIWTADKIVRWVDRGAGARNASGARIADGAVDPLGMLAAAAANPGRPIYSAEYPKRGRDASGLVVGSFTTPAVAAKRASKRGSLVPLLASAVETAYPTQALMQQWVAAYPAAAQQLARILASGMAAHAGTYRDMLAMGGIVPERTVK